MNITKEIATKVLQTVDAGLVKGVGIPKPGQMCVEAAVCYALDLPHGDDPGCVAPSLRSLKIRLNDSNWSSNDARAKGLRRLAVAQLGSADALDEKEFVRLVAELAIRTSVPIALRAVASIHKDKAHADALCEAANRCENEGTRAAAISARSVAHASSASSAASAASSASSAAYAAASAAGNAAAAFRSLMNNFASASSAAYAAASAAGNAAAADAADAAAYAAYAAAAYADDADAKKAARDKALSDFAEGVVQILIDMKAPGCVWLPLTI